MPHLKLSNTLLHNLTRIKMPRGFNTANPKRLLSINKEQLPIYDCTVLVVGSGAAGLRAAIELKRRGLDVLLATTGVGMGTSACSGSDKQTLHTASTRANGDNYNLLAQAVSAGGAMDENVAYVESVGSIQALAGLQLLGLPIPQDRYGAVLRYQTDHDEFGRATSCGPRTSRLMVKVLAEEAKNLGIPIINRASAIKIDTSGSNDSTDAACGMFITTNDTTQNPYGFSYVNFSSVVLATGGPGELYRDSVYPGKCHGSLGLALEAGITLSNLTESQFGISTNREKFPWNLSGSYVQVIPHIYSVDKNGEEIPFLAEYFPDLPTLCNAVFYKGYQWPFHAERTINYQSSLIDLAVFEQQQLGNSIYMDFNRNPLPINGQSFQLESCAKDLQAYLDNNDARCELPIERLERLNPLAIELYRQNGTDLRVTPLKFTINNQHMNGGVEVDLWGRTSLKGCYAIGELASTHGVTRPGGAALNAGQVFGIRVADHIAGTNIVTDSQPDNHISDMYLKLQNEVFEATRPGANKQSLRTIKANIQSTMSDCVGFISSASQATLAADKLKTTYNTPIQIEKTAQATNYFLWKQHALAARSIATSLVNYIERGGVSRGARLIPDKKGDRVPMSLKGPLEAFRHSGQKDLLSDQKQLISYNGTSFKVIWRPIHPLEDTSNIYFEKNWPEFLNLSIY